MDRIVFGVLFCLLASLTMALLGFFLVFFAILARLSLIFPAVLPGLLLRRRWWRRCLLRPCGSGQSHRNQGGKDQFCESFHLASLLRGCFPLPHTMVTVKTLDIGVD